jgi:hypothetical protein
MSPPAKEMPIFKQEMTLNLTSEGEAKNFSYATEMQCFVFGLGADDT